MIFQKCCFKKDFTPFSPVEWIINFAKIYLARLLPWHSSLIECSKKCTQNLFIAFLFNRNQTILNISSKYSFWQNWANSQSDNYSIHFRWPWVKKDITSSENCCHFANVVDHNPSCTTFVLRHLLFIQLNIIDNKLLQGRYI